MPCWGLYHLLVHCFCQPAGSAFRTLQVFLTPTYLGIAMEFASGGDMFDYVVKKNGLKEDEARWFFQQLIVGLDYCHRSVRGVYPVVLVGIESGAFVPRAPAPMRQRGSRCCWFGVWQRLVLPIHQATSERAACRC